MFDDMPDDWREAIDKITADWTESLDDLIQKHTEAEFLKHAAAAGANFDLVQTEALKKLIAEDVGFIAATNKEIAKSIIDDVEQLLIVKGDWASAKEAVFEHINKVFSGQEKIVIDNIGKSAKRVVLDKELGHAVIKDFVVKRKWVGNIEAYSDMVARSISQKARSMGDFEGYRTTYGIIGWRRMSSLGGKTCGICASLHGRDYYFRGEQASILPDDDGFMFEPHPNGYCYQTPIYDDWVGVKNLSETQLDDHVKRWKIGNKMATPNLKRVPTGYGRIDMDKYKFTTSDATKLLFKSKAENKLFSNSVYADDVIKTNDLITAGKTSKSLNQVKGVYTNDRLKVHDDIIAAFYKDTTGPQKAYLFGGPPGSGKSQLMKHVSGDSKNYIYINNDDIKKLLPQYRGSNSAFFHEEAGDIKKKLLARALQSNSNIIIDMTLRNYDKTIALYDNLIDLGYDVQLLSTNLPLKQTLSRAVLRAVDPDKEGRFVPIDYILDTAERTNIVQFKYADYVDHITIFDSNVGFGDDLVVILSK